MPVNHSLGALRPCDLHADAAADSIELVVAAKVLSPRQLLSQCLGKRHDPEIATPEMRHAIAEESPETVSQAGPDVHAVQPNAHRVDMHFRRPRWHVVLQA
jgi:hypothetical protein